MGILIVVVVPYAIKFEAPQRLLKGSLMNNDHNDPPKLRFFNKQTSMLLATGGPFTLLCVLALAGVHLAWWMVALAGIATVALLISAILAASQKPRSVSGASGNLSAITGFVTSTSGKRHAPLAPIKWKSSDGVADVEIVADATRQTVLGFGAALTGSSCLLLNRMQPDKRQALMSELFSPQGLNLNTCRLSIGASDFNPGLYSYCDGQADPNLTRFSIDKDRAYVLPMVKEAQALSGDMFWFASPWSPPGWMKASGTMLGGTMRADYFDAYAQYFVRFIEAYKADGVIVRAVSPQNEVDADQGGTMPSCTWTMALEKQFVLQHLGPALRGSGHDTLIWMIDHNFDLEQRALDTVRDPQLPPYLDGISWHGYAGSADAVSHVHAAQPTINHYFTEFNTFASAPNYLTNWTHWGTVIGQAMRNWCRCYTLWNVALDEEGQPRIGPYPCGGLITINSKTGDVSYSGGYWALGHYSKAVRRDAVNVESRGDIAGLTHAAFVNPNGQRVLVLSNAGPQRTITLSDGGNLASVQLDADSATTLMWQ